MFLFDLPASQDDFPDEPAMRYALLRRWNDNRERYSPARYTSATANRYANYADPRSETPPRSLSAISWRGFPRTLSCWHWEEPGDLAARQAEIAADTLMPMVYWTEYRDGELEVNEAPVHHLPFYASAIDSTGEPAYPMARFAAFPRRVEDDGSIGEAVVRWRRQQDEYLEWHATRNSEGTIETLTFSSETPDYWIALAQESRDRVIDLYRQHVGDHVEQDDLFHRTDLAVVGPDTNGEPVWLRWPVQHTYDELNKWTTTNGIMHLTHPANTLAAQIALAGAACDVVSSEATEPDTQTGASRCMTSRLEAGGHHGVGRSSDLLIGYGIGQIVRSGRRVTLADPVGTYIAMIDLDGLEGANGEWIGRDALKIVRGRDDAFEPRILRFEIEIASDLPFRLGECMIEGQVLERGGQVARLTTMQLYATDYGGEQVAGGDDGNTVRQLPTSVEKVLMSDCAQGMEAGSTDGRPSSRLLPPYLGPALGEASLSQSLDSPVVSRALNDDSVLKPSACLKLSRFDFSNG